MEKSVEEGAIADDNGGNLLDFERKPVRRRLIQSTLFPHRSQCVQVDGDEGKEGKEEDEEGDDGEEYRESVSKGKSKRKRKAKAQPRAANKDAVMGKEALSQRTENRSPGTVGSDFFLNVSERRFKQKQQKEQGRIDLPEGSHKACTTMESLSRKRSPQQLKKKRQGNTTTCKGPKPSGLRGPFSSHLITNHKTDAVEDSDLLSENMIQPVIDLRLEAKITAEENARLSAGRQTHPFFSQWKSGKRFQETPATTVVDSKCCSVLHSDEGTYGPIHVFEMLENDQVSVSPDWRNWMFHERTSLYSCCTPENACSSVFEGFVEPLKFDNFPSISNALRISFLQNEFSLDQSRGQEKKLSTVSPAASFVLPDVQEEHHQLLKHLEASLDMQNLQAHEKTGCVNNLDVELQDRSLQDRMMSFHLDCADLPIGTLWTNKYQPGKAFQVCGNGESVRFLSEWLRCWCERDLKSSKNATHGDECFSQDSDQSWYQNDSDTENMNGGVSLKNVLLVTGPVGSGKSAAIYACAKEQGFEVIEVSASDWRNGALVKEKFGQAVESHRFKWTTNDPAGSCKKQIMEYSTVQQCSKAAHDNEVVELTSSADEEESENIMEGSGSVFTEIGTACSRGGKKTLVLFEDVDIIFDEDRGFIAAIQHFAETARRPMILTSNSKDPLLPDNLDRLEVRFTVPSLKELFTHLLMVCAAEKSDLQPQLIERFIGFCQGDIRKTIMLLQFWCQGRNQGKKVQCAYGPLPFDVEAGHWILCKMIPWEFPSQLSELVEKEISKSMSVVKDNATSMKAVEEEKLNCKQVHDTMEMGNNETDSINAKKESMLIRNCSTHDDNEFLAQIDGVREFSNSSGSPVALTRRSAKHRSHTVVSSDSDDEFFSGNLQVVSDILLGDQGIKVLPGVSVKSFSPVVATQDYLDQSTDQVYYSEREKSGENLYKCLASATAHSVCESDKWIDISCVPESSFVPETEINNGKGLLSRTVSCGHVAVAAETVSVSCAKSIKSMSLIKGDNTDEAVQELHKNSETILGNTCNLAAELVHRDEEVGDSQNEHVDSLIRGYQVMDECSRMDFHKGSISVENSKCPVVVNSVQETWRRLRSCRADLKPYVNSEQKDTCKIVKLTSQMTNLISEADLMLGCCQLLISDSLEPSMVPCVDSDAFCWCHEQLEMVSTIAQHGLCFYDKESAAMESKLGSRNKVDLAWEMLTSTTNTMALGKLVTQGTNTRETSSDGCGLEIGQPRSEIFMNSELSLHSMIQSIVPPRLYSALKGVALHEYMSSLSQISRSEASRLSESVDKTKQRRARVGRHYLSTGALSLCPEDVLLLAQHSCFGKAALESMVASCR